VPAAKKPDDRQFKVGDKIRVNLHHGKIEIDPNSVSFRKCPKGFTRLVLALQTTN
jgi:hypothetical protein